MDWEVCVNKGLVKEIKIDNKLINCLLNSSEDKVEVCDRLELDKTSCSAKILLVYDSLIDVLKSIGIRNKVMICNHECFPSFLSEVCEEPEFADDFIRFKNIKNQISYYGKQVLLNDARFLINEIRLLRLKLLNKYFG